ncbi:hypothetical protein RIR_jg11784.t1 [Rhizophagus irregularis DAOM 181602=DAOM 197198]|nr:hypothetical protein RIR_jg11784.t1 [Rhizophagus irregularis DAOM 181602=DAOM 197198]
MTIDRNHFHVNRQLVTHYLHMFIFKMTQQSSITPFLTAPSPNTPPYKDSIQLVKKKQKISRKKTSWI